MRDVAPFDLQHHRVDDLHERAGSKRVYHLHGSLFEFRCDRCGREYRDELPPMPEPVESVDPPRCVCSGLIRPNVVWFGEALPDEAWQLLLTIEIAKTKSGQLKWDFKAKAWRDTWEIER